MGVDAVELVVIAAGLAESSLSSPPNLGQGALFDFPNQ